MANYLPQSDIPDVREYIYVDTDRVRSLLAQLEGGLHTDTTTSTSRSSKVHFGIKSLFTEKGEDDGRSDAMSMADLHVSRLEETAEALRVLTDVSDLAGRQKKWMRGAVRRLLEPGMLVRIEAPTILVDPRGLTDSFRAFQAIDDGDEDFDGIVKTIDAAYGPALTVSIRPVEDDARAAFIGHIPATHSFQALERELLLGRVGPDPVQMTSLFTISRIPTDRDGKEAIEAQLADYARRLERLSEDTLDREILDGMVSRTAALLEEYGLTPAPKWPAISIVPLAVYRNIMPGPTSDDIDAALAEELEQDDSGL